MINPETITIGLNESTLLPKQYIVAYEEPYHGGGVHNVSQLETICENNKELIHQQRVIIQELKKMIGSVAYESINLGLQLRQNQLSGEDARSGNEVLSIYLNNLINEKLS